MTMTVSVRVAHKNAQSARNQRYHDIRKTFPKYVNKKNSHLNSIIRAHTPEAAIAHECTARRTLRDTQRKSKAAPAIVTIGIISFGRKAQPVISRQTPADQDMFFKRLVERIATEFNTDVASITAHRDESALHCHFSLVAYDKAGCPLSVTITPKRAVRIQDIAGEVSFEMFPNLGIKRGKPKAQRIADGDDASTIIHRTVKKLHEDLPIELLQIQQMHDAMSADIDALQETIAKKTHYLSTIEEKTKNQEIEHKKEIARMDAETAEYGRLMSQKKKAQSAQMDMLRTEKTARIAVLDAHILALDAHIDGLHAHVATLKTELVGKEALIEQLKSMGMYNAAPAQTPTPAPSPRTPTFSYPTPY